MIEGFLHWKLNGVTASYGPSTEEPSITNHPFATTATINLSVQIVRHADQNHTGLLHDLEVAMA